MPRIKCFSHCIWNINNYCNAEEIEMDEEYNYCKTEEFNSQKINKS